MGREVNTPVFTAMEREDRLRWHARGTTCLFFFLQTVRSH